MYFSRRGYPGIPHRDRPLNRLHRQPRIPNQFHNLSRPVRPALGRGVVPRDGGMVFLFCASSAASGGFCFKGSWGRLAVVG